MLKDLFKKTKYITVGANVPLEAERPQISCPSCGQKIREDIYASAFRTCPLCGAIGRMTGRERVAAVCDEGSFVEWDGHITSCDPIGFPGYAEKIEGLRSKTGENEGILTGCGKIGGFSAAIGVMEHKFMLGSMGSAVGEKIVRLFERAITERLPVVLFCCSGGARMQEGILSLMQMAKTSGAVGRHSSAGLLYVSVLTDPTTGGVTASFATLGDIILAEPKATIGFAGRRVIEGTIGEKLPDDFQTSEFMLAHGFVDRVVERKALNGVLAQLLSMHEGGGNDGA